MKKNNQAVDVPAASPSRCNARQTRKVRNRALRLVALLLAGLVLVSAIAVYAFWRSLTAKINIIPSDEGTLPSEFNLPTESLDNPLPSETGIRNILLLGVDTRDASSIKERTDSMMILTVDTKNKKIKLTSLQRDMLVYLPGRGEPVKINSANVFGGPALAIRAVNDSLRLDIKDFMIVNMFGMERLIDLAGGVMIDVTEDEVPYLNQSLHEANIIYPDTPASPLVKKAGLQRLNGRQAVSYARIRKVGSDYKRMERQRTVMQALLDTFMAASLPVKTRVVQEGLGLITTSLPAATLTDLALKTLPLLSQSIEQLQIPIKGFHYEDARGTWVNRCDFNGMIPHLQAFIFGRTYPFDPVKEIPGAPNSSIPLPSLPPEEHEPSPTPTTAPSPQTTTAETTGTTAPSTAETLATTATMPSQSETTSTDATDPSETEPTETTPETTATDSTTEKTSPTSSHTSPSATHP